MEKLNLMILMKNVLKLMILLPRKCLTLKQLSLVILSFLCLKQFYWKMSLIILLKMKMEKHMALTVLKQLFLILMRKWNLMISMKSALNLMILWQWKYLILKRLILGVTMSFCCLKQLDWKRSMLNVLKMKMKKHVALTTLY